MDRAHLILLPLAALAMWCAFQCANSPRILQEPAPVVQPDWVSEMRREAQRQAWVNPMQPHDTLMPGGSR